MTPRTRRFALPAVVLLLAACILVPAHVTVQAGNPHGAYYSSENTSIFWFLHVSDLHIGISDTTDTSNLQWLVTTARTKIAPQFIVATGDLTDSTNGNWLGLPNGPYQAEWDTYKSILYNAGVGENVWYDLPGNHDAYNDQDFSYYLANSVQGRATGKTQVSWTRTFPFGTYHFLGANTADNSGDAFSIFWPYGDYAGLDATELTYITQQLAANSSANLTFVFGHHPVTDTGASGDTWLYYGHQAFVSALDQNSASAYNYGHTHANSQVLFTGNSYTGLMGGDGIHYNNVDSLGKDSPFYYSLIAVDCNGVSSVTRPVNSWPVVLITAPVDRYMGTAVNPYSYTVPNAIDNPIRALVFDTGTITSVSYRIDGATTWHPMTQVASNPALWETRAWNASALASGDHTIEVKAVGSATVSDTVKVTVVATGNRAPVAVNDAYSTAYNTALSVAAPGVLKNDTDADGNPLTAVKVSDPSHGTLTLNANGSFTYTPNSTYSGSDTFTYKASDGQLLSAAATVAITVADAVTIPTATYTLKKKLLAVTATSTGAPAAVLTVNDTWTMSYKSRTKTYSLQVSTPTNPGTVTVTSTLGGSATAPVIPK